MHGRASTGERYGYARSQNDSDKADAQTGQVNSNLSQFDGPVQSTPFYKSMLQQGTSSTNQAYDNAKRNMRTSMEGAGIGGSSGAVQGNDAAMEGQRSSALGQVGTNATQAATGLQMQANQQRLGEAGMYSGAGLGYFGDANQAEIERLKSQSGLGQMAMQAAMMAATA